MLNRFKTPLEPDAVVTGYQEAQPFTRFYGSLACDQPLEVSFTFSNDEVAPDGHWVTDDTLPALNYDAEALKQLYDPAKSASSSKYFVTIFGRWLRVEVKNVGKTAPTFMRIYVRGSVF